MAHAVHDGARGSAILGPAEFRADHVLAQELGSAAAAAAFYLVAQAPDLAHPLVHALDDFVEIPHSVDTLLRLGDAAIQTAFLGLVNRSHPDGVRAALPNVAAFDRRVDDYADATIHDEGVDLLLAANLRLLGEAARGQLRSELLGQAEAVDVAQGVVLGAGHLE